MTGRIARMLGWPEARWRDEFVTRQATGATHDEYVAAPTPRLRVWREFEGWWMWQVDDPGGWVIDTNSAATHAQALAVGLAALETASVRTTR